MVGLGRTGLDALTPAAEDAKILTNGPFLIRGADRETRAERPDRLIADRLSDLVDGVER